MSPPVERLFIRNVLRGLYGTRASTWNIAECSRQYTHNMCRVSHNIIFPLTGVSDFALKSTCFFAF